MKLSDFALPLIGEQPTQLGGPPQDQIGNELLRRLAAEDYELISPYLERVPLKLNAVLADAGDPISELCFPEAGVIGFADVLDDGQRLAVAITGREGFVGWPLSLGNDRWPHEVIVRAEAGTALRIAAAPLLEIINSNQRVRLALLRYTNSVVAQMSRTIVSNLIHPVEKRTARWLLLYLDRIRGEEITITHEELGVMLGVRRNSITDAIHILEGAGAIKGYRGRLIVHDRDHLEKLAGETYGYPEQEYSRLVPTAAAKD